MIQDTNRLQNLFDQSSDKILSQVKSKYTAYDSGIPETACHWNTTFWKLYPYLPTLFLHLPKYLLSSDGKQSLNQ